MSQYASFLMLHVPAVPVPAFRVFHTCTLGFAVVCLIRAAVRIFIICHLLTLCDVYTEM